VIQKLLNNVEAAMRRMLGFAYGSAFSFLSDAIKQSLWYIFP
jgi:hypothetical protein